VIPTLALSVVQFTMPLKVEVAAVTLSSGAFTFTALAPLMSTVPDAVSVIVHLFGCAMVISWAPSSMTTL